MLDNNQPYYRRTLTGNVVEKNQLILQQFLKHYQDSNIKRTHFFNERYENIYLTEKHIPELSTLIQEANQCAINILGKKDLNTDNIKHGYWFNFMPPTSTTTLHTHDDDDELLSCVYYVYAPEKSGNLIIHTNKSEIEIEPKAGDFVFFNPDVAHEVSKNNSSEHRLSIGINFGQTSSSGYPNIP